MQEHKDRAAMAEKISLTEAKKRIDEFSHPKPVTGRGGGGAAPIRKSKKIARRKGKR